MGRNVFQYRVVRAGVAVIAMVAIAGSSRVAGAQGVHGKRKEVYKEQIEQLEEAWRTAQLSGDVAAMDRLLSEDYVGITMTGQVVTKIQQLERMRKRQIVVSKIELDDTKVKLLGTTAIVTSLADVDGTNEGVSIHGMYRYTRVYSRLPSGTWKITNFEATRVGTPQGEGHDGERPPRRMPAPQ